MSKKKKEEKVWWIEKLSNKVNKASEVLLMVIVGIMIVTTLIGVFNRFVFRFSVSWTNEVATYLLIWMSTVGACIATKRGLHISITFILKKLRKKLRLWIVIISQAMTMIFLIYATIYGFKLCISQMKQYSPVAGIPIGLVYLAVPVGSLIMIMHLISSLKPILQFIKDCE
ncbi:TRAP transporter small permease [Candidatus Aerophobetes bacterium]|nr:TRAP transporter small permease [Candidatus Aerophobetes bacterium]